MDLIKAFSLFNGGFAMFTLVFGTLSNLMVVFVVCMSKSLRSTPTFIFIAADSLIEIIPLYLRNLNSYTLAFFGYIIDSTSESFCKCNFYLHYFSLQSAVWILIAMSIERYLSIVIKTWRSRKFNSKKALIVSIAITVFFFFLNFYLITQPVYSVITTTVNGTIKVTQRCVYTALMGQWAEFNTYIYSIVPFIILAIVNCLLIYSTVFKKSTIERSSQEKSKRRSLTLSVLAMTLSFIILTIPTAIVGGYFFSRVFTLPYGPGLISFLSTLRFLYHTSNLPVLLIFNKKFSSEFKALIRIMSNNKVGSFDGTSVSATTRIKP